MAGQRPEDLDRFVAELLPRLVGTLTLYCGDQDVAEELTQEALTRICRDWERVRTMASPEAWTHRVAINLAHSHYRRRAAGWRARRRAQARAGAGQALPDTADAVAVRDALQALPARHRTVLVLRYYADLSIAELATALDISESAAKSRSHRATNALRAMLDDKEDADVR